MTRVFATESGSGAPIVLFHGFPFNHHIWDSVIPGLSASLRVIRFDLPGFGSSERLPLPFSIDDVAQRMIEALHENGIKDCALAGHSMGGYVALAMAARAPELFTHLILFHSTAYADSAEKKASRDKVIEFVRKNGAEEFTSGFIQPLFADARASAIAVARSIAVQSDGETVIGYTAAMRDRPDRTSVLRQFHKPILIIGGRKDSGIPLDSLKEQAGLSPFIKLVVLEDAGHMGMLELPAKSTSTILDFIHTSNRP